MSYNEAREVKAVAVVDDIILLTALLATAGIAYVGISEYWTNGQWLEDEDSPVLDPEMAEWGQGFADRMQSQWDNDVLQKAIELGYVDPETGEYIGALEGTGGSGNTGGDGDNDDDNNKFPTWQKLKELVAKNGGNLSQALGTGAGFLLGAYGATMLESSKEGAKMPGGLPADINTILRNADNAYVEYCEHNAIPISEYPYHLTYIYKRTTRTISMYTFYFKSGDYYAYIDSSNSRFMCGVSNRNAKGIRAELMPSGNIYVTDGLLTSGLSLLPEDTQYFSAFGNIPIASSLEESLAFYNNP